MVRIVSLSVAALLISLAHVAPAQAATQWELDTAHTGLVFEIGHLGMSRTYGRFNTIEGDFAFSADDLAGSSFSFTVQAKSVDTGHEKRDNHLRSPDFLNVRQYPEITFKSTKIEPGDESNTFKLTGDLTLHGTTKTITVDLVKLGEGKDPWGNERIGFETEFSIKRSDYGMDKMLNAVGDEVELQLSFEGTK